MIAESVDIQRAKRMLFAGHLTITIENESGRHFVFEFRPALDRDRDTNDEAPWTGRKWWLREREHYVGLVERHGEGLTLKRTARSTSDRAVNYATGLVLSILNQGREREGYHLFVSTLCGRCNHKLEDPESIQWGFGPTCRKELGLS